MYVCVCVYIYICVYCIHIFLITYKYICVYIYIFIYTFTLTCTDVRAFAVYINTFIYLYIYIWSCDIATIRYHPSHVPLKVFDDSWSLLCDDEPYIYIYLLFDSVIPERTSNFADKTVFWILLGGSVRRKMLSKKPQWRISFSRIWDSPIEMFTSWNSNLELAYLFPSLFIMKSNKP